MSGLVRVSALVRVRPEALVHVAQFLLNRRGTVAVMVALSLPMLTGFVGLALDVGSWYTIRSGMQEAADQAALAAAMSYQSDGAGCLTKPGRTVPCYQTQALAIAAANGFAAAGSTVVNASVPSGTRYANPIQVSISQPGLRRFSGFFMRHAPTIAATAVVGRAPGEACVVALDPSSTDSVYVQGNSNITLTACDLYNNSSANEATGGNGNASISVRNAYLTGGYSVHGGLTATGSIQTDAGAVADPYVGRTIPAFSGCDHSAFTRVGGGTLSPGVYCNGMNLVSGTFTLNPGIYIIDGGNFSANGTVTGNGVTIILTSSSRSSYGN